MSKLGEIVLVCTKYDSPVLTVNVPQFKEIKEVYDIEDITPEFNCLSFIAYKLAEIEHGLEGVRFFHYRP